MRSDDVSCISSNSVRTRETVSRILSVVRFMSRSVRGEGQSGWRSWFKFGSYQGLDTHNVELKQQNKVITTNNNWLVCWSTCFPYVTSDQDTVKPLHTKRKRKFSPRPCLHVTFSPFLSAAPLIFFTVCNDFTIGIHSNHFKTLRKTVRKVMCKPDLTSAIFLCE